MTFLDGQYYVAFILAILLARGLGPIFFVPMVLDLGFDVCLELGVFSGWDIRLLVVSYHFGIFLWVLALAGNLRKSTFVVMLLLDMLVVFKGIWPEIQAAGVGQDFWNASSTAILDVWQSSILVVILSVVIRSTVVAKARGQYVDILTNPKKRFLIPIGMWSLMLELPNYFQPWVPAWWYDNRFSISANFLVWGWVALEFPYWLMYRRLKKKYS